MKLFKKNQEVAFKVFKKNQENKKGKEKKTLVEETVDDKPIVELKEKLEKINESKML